MKKYFQKPRLIFSLEKDDKINPTGMQLRVWKLDRGATLLVRLFRHNSNAKKKLWDGKRTNGEVSDLILDFLENQECITNKESWDYSVDTCNTLTDQDEYEEKEKCIYFAWLVKKSKLDF